jgi:hypothetical protein
MSYLIRKDSIGINHQRERWKYMKQKSLATNSNFTYFPFFSFLFFGKSLGRYFANSITRSTIGTSTWEKGRNQESKSD